MNDKTKTKKLYEQILEFTVVGKYLLKLEDDHSRFVCEHKWDTNIENEQNSWGITITTQAREW